MKFQAYPTYKDSGVDWLGKVPEHWKIKRIKHIFQIRKRIAGKEGYSVLSITQNGIKIKDIISGEGQLAMDYSKYQFVEIGDFAMNHMDLLTGFIDISKYYGVTSPDYRVFTLTDINSVAGYYLYLMQMGYTNKIFYAQGQGVANIGRWRFQTEPFNNFSIPYPSKEEQQSIANYIDRETSRIDELSKEKERFIELLKEKRQALISHAVTKGLNPTVKMKKSGIAWLGEVPEHWNIKKLGLITSKIGSGKTPKGGAEIYSESGVMFIRSQNVHDSGMFLDDIVYISEEIDNSMAGTRVISGDILLNVTGGSIGRTCLVPTPFFKANVNQHVCIIRVLNKNIINYVSWFLKSNYSKGLIDFYQNGAGREGLNFDQISNIKICMPNDEKEIKFIANYLDQKTRKIDALITETQHSINLLKEHRAALISAAVTGKIDIREFS